MFYISPNSYTSILLSCDNGGQVLRFFYEATVGSN